MSSNQHGWSAPIHCWFGYGLNPGEVKGRARSSKQGY